MKTTYKIVLASFFMLFVVSCDQISKVIDDLLTFNLPDKTLEFPLLASTPTGTIISQELAVPLDSATLAKNNTNTSKIKTCSITKLTIPTFSDPTYTIANFDTLFLAVKADGMAPITLGTYSSSTGAIVLSKQDFAPFVKAKNPVFVTSYKCNTAPATNITFSTIVTLTFTAQPL